MKLLKDIDAFYKKALPLIITYVLGWFIGGIIGVCLFLALLFGWRPFKSYEHMQHSNYVPYKCPGMEIYHGN